MRYRSLVAAGLVVSTFVAIAACGGSVGSPTTESCAAGSPGSTTEAGTTTTNPPATTTGRVPAKHRAVATACDGTRSTSPPANLPDGGDGSVKCTTHDECTAGVNGRCTGNPHDGWRCTCDECSNDTECGSGICECDGQFRTDANKCLTSNGCRLDSDCGSAGYCSPSLGSCGSFDKTMGYYCHTAADECVDDSDCTDAGPGSYGTPYCAYSPSAGKWACSNSQCAG